MVPENAEITFEVLPYALPIPKHSWGGPGKDAHITDDCSTWLQYAGSPPRKFSASDPRCTITPAATKAEGLVLSSTLALKSQNVVCLRGQI